MITRTPSSTGGLQGKKCCATGVRRNPMVERKRQWRRGGGRNDCDSISLRRAGVRRTHTRPSVGLLCLGAPRIVAGPCLGANAWSQRPYFCGWWLTSYRTPLLYRRCCLASMATCGPTTRSNPTTCCPLTFLVFDARSRPLTG